MATRVRLRRGTTEQTAAFTGVEGEITIDTTKKTVVVHDGTTVGGNDLLRADARRGYIRKEHFLNDGNWSKANKPDLKRIEVEVFGGGGGGATGAGGGGGASGGHGYIVLEVADIITDTVALVIGQGGAAGEAGTASNFSTYITVNGGNFGNDDGTGGASGTTTGTNTIDMGGYPGGNGDGSSIGGNGGGPGGGGQAAASGVSGGGGARNTAGAQGSIIIYEIYGEV